jgi:hypothetical protein
MEKNKNEITWDDIKKMNAETSKILQETIKLFNEEKQLIMEEKKRMEEERKKREIEREEEKKRMEEERKKREIEKEEERKREEKFEKQFERTWEHLGGISRSNGEFCEEYFINCFKENKTFLGEKFDNVLEYHRPLLPKINDEYDLVMLNGSTVVLIEVKYKAGINDVGKMFSKLTSYRANYPQFNDYKIYLGLASFRFPDAIRERAAAEGVVLIEQRGEKIEVISENIRAW